MLNKDEDKDELTRISTLQQSSSSIRKTFGGITVFWSRAIVAVNTYLLKNRVINL